MSLIIALPERIGPWAAGQRVDHEKQNFDLKLLSTNIHDKVSQVVYVSKTPFECVLCSVG